VTYWQADDTGRWIKKAWPGGREPRLGTAV